MAMEMLLHQEQKFVEGRRILIGHTHVDGSSRLLHSAYARLQEAQI